MTVDSATTMRTPAKRHNAEGALWKSDNGSRPQAECLMDISVGDRWTIGYIQNAVTLESTDMEINLADKRH